VVGLVIFLRLWQDLPRRYVVLPGEGWTFGLVVVYYCLTIILIVSNAYLVSGFVEQRYTYLWVALGTLLAVAGASWLTHQATAERGVASATVRILGAGNHDKAVGVLVAGLLVVVVVGSYGLAHVVGPLINGALDQLFGPPPSPPPRG